MSSQFFTTSEMAAQFEKGGLFQITSARGGATRFSLALAREATAPSLWASDEGYLYPPALAAAKEDLSRWLLVKTKNAEDTWRIALESLQTGIFSWVFLRPSQPCSSAGLRRLQVAAEKNATRVLILGKAKKLPHWMFRLSLEVDEDRDAKSALSGKFILRHRSGRSVFFPDSQGEPARRAGDLA